MLSYWFEILMGRGGLTIKIVYSYTIVYCWSGEVHSVSFNLKITTTTTTTKLNLFNKKKTHQIFN